MVSLEIPQVPDKNQSYKQQLIDWLHHRHSPKNVGFDDVHYPTFVEFRPTLVTLPFGYKLPQDFLIRDNALDLKSLTPQLLETLSSKDLKLLLDYLAAIKVELKWSDQFGHVQSGKKHALRDSKHWEKSNAAAALCLSMGTGRQMGLFISMLSLAPEAILPAFHGHMPALLDGHVTAHIIAAMLLTLDQEDIGNASQTANTIAYLTHQGLNYWVAKDITKLNPFLSALFETTSRLIAASNPQSPEALIGLLYGSVLSGAMQKAEEIKKIDEKRIWLVGLIANLVWAATAFIGITPMAGP
ncbi:MAG TPA: hypothetical protein VEK06_03295, partial [Myxococcota bacterium]|nr:hypothetical protein [Myxococcota bacterium]